MHCRSHLAFGDKTCPSCGQPVAPVFSPPPAVSAQQVAYQDRRALARARARKRNLILLVVVIALVGTAAAVVLTRKPSTRFPSAAESSRLCNSKRAISRMPAFSLGRTDQAAVFRSTGESAGASPRYDQAPRDPVIDLASGKAAGSKQPLVWLVCMHPLDLPLQMSCSYTKDPSSFVPDSAIEHATVEVYDEWKVDIWDMHRGTLLRTETFAINFSGQLTPHVGPKDELSQANCPPRAKVGDVNAGGLFHTAGEWRNLARDKAAALVTELYRTQ